MSREQQINGTLSDGQDVIERNLADTILVLEMANGVLPSGLVSVDRLDNQLSQAKQQRMWLDSAIERGELMLKSHEVARLQELVAQYEEVHADHQRLVRELDVIINGDGAAPQASLCDIVSQMRALSR